MCNVTKKKKFSNFFGEWARKRGEQEGLTPRQYRLQQRQLGK